MGKNAAVGCGSIEFSFKKVIKATFGSRLKMENEQNTNI